MPLPSLMTDKTDAQIEAEAQERCGLVGIRVPLTREGQALIGRYSAGLGDPVAVISADATITDGVVSDVDEGRYVVIVDVN